MVVLPLGQDKPDFVKRRVRKLLTAGVVSALACVVKSENPALTNSCRELISRYGAEHGGSCLEFALPAGLVLLVNPGFWEQKGVCGHPVVLGLSVSYWVVLVQVLSSNYCCPVCRVFLALVAEAEDRGGVVAQGGGKVS